MDDTRQMTSIKIKASTQNPMYPLEQYLSMD
ncbi:hypothetical protein J2X05_004153 [Cellvibrio fibrivorans]|uniref:Uncharacterized protein n=1 Tax=Cellvibrio fibrivorans TaxID=126350 RepID=A0ABU1V3T0_9GAMM|nr:hypothetical protein [Cellvibrio fibrivorans]